MNCTQSFSLTVNSLSRKGKTFARDDAETVTNSGKCYGVDTAYVPKSHQGNSGERETANQNLFFCF